MIERGGFINPAIYVLMFLPLIVVLMQQSNLKKQLMMKRIKNKKGNKQMYELAQMFINKKCLIYTYNGQIVGTIKQIAPGAILLQSDKTNEIVNLDFIMRIREYPTKKNGKEKSVILD